MTITTAIRAAEPDDRALDTMVREAHHRIRRAMKRIRRPEARVAAVRSPIGRLLVAESPRGIAAVHFLEVSGPERTLELLRQHFDLVENAPFAERMSREIDRYLDGDLNVLSHPVDWALVESDFHLRALKRLCKVGPGSVITYQGLAAAIGQPSGPRAVGNAMATNPVPLYVPCHRVISSDGTVGKYGGGVATKVTLLRTEGFEIEPDLRFGEHSVMGHRGTHIYCRATCSAARRARIANVTIFADSAHAREAGLRACKLCHPA
ncbi:MAG TPA: methylated-DNA--[protein]-cysteine S-methyltransferase [Candidatus Binataceae bacterium]|nr:methylated-DNA--[protein]-cysteine S-methyltransferase [Candidatus Binataceae bacterium]